MLFYGTSYLLESMLRLLCYHKPVAMHASSLCPPNVNGCWRKVDYMDMDEYRRIQMEGGRTLVSITNYPLLQSSQRSRELQAFLAAEQLDAAVFMQPHPDCFMKWMSNRTGPQCVDLTRMDMHEDAVRKRAQQRQVFSSAFNDNRWLEVVPWMTRLDPATVSHKVLNTDALVKAHACCQSECGNNTRGHQCIPGTPDRTAAHIATWLRHTLAEHTPRYAMEPNSLQVHACCVGNES